LLLILLSLLLLHIILCSCCAPRRVAAVSVPPTYSAHCSTSGRDCVSSPRVSPRPQHRGTSFRVGASRSSEAFPIANVRIARSLTRLHDLRNGRENDGTRGSRAPLTAQERMVRETRPTSDTRKTGRRLSASASVSDTARAVRHRLGSTRVRTAVVHVYMRTHYRITVNANVLVQPRRPRGRPGSLRDPRLAFASRAAGGRSRGRTNS